LGHPQRRRTHGQVQPGPHARRRVPARWPPARARQGRGQDHVLVPGLPGVRLPDGFRVGHWTDAEARTGCTVVLAPTGTRGSVDVRGGGTGSHELETLSPLANSEGPNAVLLTGGSAFGLAAASGVVRWLEERGLGRPTPAGSVPLVAAAVVFDLVEGSSSTRPGPEEGYAACEAATAGGAR